MASDDPATPGVANVSNVGTSQIAKLTHDLNNVFTVIYTALDMVLTSEVPISSTSSRSVLTEAQSAAKRGAQMVTSIRELIGRHPVSFPGAAATGHHDFVEESPEGSEHILVISRRVETRLVLRAVLSYRGYRVVDIQDVSTAGENIAGKPVDLVVAEHEPEIEKALRAMVPSTPVLFLSETIPAGADGNPRVQWCRLPFNNAALAGQVRGILTAGQAKT